MRILHVNDYAYPMGGAETYIQALMAAQAEAGHEVALMATDSRGGGTLESLAENLKPMPHLRWHARGSSSNSRAIRAAVQVYNSSAKALARVADAEFAPDAVHVHMFLGQLSPAVLSPFIRSGRRLIHTAHTYKIACPKGTRQLPDGSLCQLPSGVACARHCSPAYFVQLGLWRLLHPSLKTCFDSVIAPSAAMAAALRQDGVQSVQVLPYGSTFPILSRSALPMAPAILYVGRITASKGVHVLLEAFEEVLARVPAARLTFAGAGPDEARLRANIEGRSLRGRAEMTGRVPADAIQELQNRHRVQCIPSLWPDNSPLVIYECLSRGVPMVATHTGGIPELVRDGVEGLLVPPNDPSALAEALIRILTDEEFCKGAAAASGRRAAQFRMEDHVLQLEAIYRGNGAEGPARAA